MRGCLAHPQGIIGDTIRAVLVRPDIDSEHALARPQPGDARQRRVDPAIVESHAVDHCLVLGEAEQAGAGIAALGPGRERAHLDRAEAQREQARNRLGILVQAGGQPDSIGKGQSSQLDR